MKAALFVVLFAAFAQAGAQSGVLVSSLPEDYETRGTLEVAGKVLVARGWTLAPSDRTTLDARKDNSRMRVFVRGYALRFADQSVRDRGQKQREHRDEGPQLTAVPQAELDALRADLAAAFEGKHSLSGAAVPKVPGQVLLVVPAGADTLAVMKAARDAFVGRRWEVTAEGDDAFVADIRGVQESTTLKVFLADGALRFIDRSTDRNGAKAQVPERWLNNIRVDLRRVIITLAPRPERGPVARATAPAQGDAEERLRTLKSLLDRGLITQAEYEAKRAEILKGL
jgi:hypothetical protein